MSRAFRPAWAWTGTELARAPVLTVDTDGTLGPHRGEPIRDIGGIVLPGLINAHTHLELGPVRFPPGMGLAAWAPLIRASDPPSAARAGQNVHAAIQSGTAAVGEITNTGLSAPVLSAARMPARVFREILGVDQPNLPANLSGRPVPHGTHSTHPDIARACAALDGPWSIHFDEDPDEARFLHEQGPWVEQMRRWGRDLGRFPFPHRSPARHLADLGVLSPRALLVHATCTRGDDLDLVAASGARVVLCVRSNLALTGRTPDVDGMLARGMALAIGTDSLASAPDLDMYAELRALRATYPHVPTATWLTAATAGGADALALPLGRLSDGLAPGLFHVDVDAADPVALLDALLDGTPRPTRWLACPRA